MSLGYVQSAQDNCWKCNEGFRPRSWCEIVTQERNDPIVFYRTTDTVRFYHDVCFQQLAQTQLSCKDSTLRDRAITFLEVQDSAVSNCWALSSSFMAMEMPY